MTTTMHPTRQAQRLHMSHLATIHRTPLTKRSDGATRRRATAFTPMARDPLSVEFLDCQKELLRHLGA